LKYYNHYASVGATANEYEDMFIECPNNQLNIFQWKGYTLREDLPFVDGLILDSKGKLTDFVDSCAFVNAGYLLSDKAIDVITKFSLMEYRIVPLSLKRKGKQIEGYNWITFRDSTLGVFSDYLFIDYVKSTETIDFEYDANNYEGWENSTRWFARARNRNSLDVYFYDGYLYDIMNGCFSQRLKNAIQTEGLTGLNFEELDYNFLESNSKMPDSTVSFIEKHLLELKRTYIANYQKLYSSFTFPQLGKLNTKTLFLNAKNNSIEKPVDQKYFENYFIQKGIKGLIYVKMPDDFKSEVVDLEQRRRLFMEWYFDQQEKDDPIYTEFFM